MADDHNGVAELELEEGISRSSSSGRVVSSYRKGDPVSRQPESQGVENGLHRARSSGELRVSTLTPSSTAVTKSVGTPPERSLQASGGRPSSQRTLFKARKAKDRMYSSDTNLSTTSDVNQQRATNECSTVALFDPYKDFKSRQIEFQSSPKLPSKESASPASSDKEPSLDETCLDSPSLVPDSYRSTLSSQKAVSFRESSLAAKQGNGIACPDGDDGKPCFNAYNTKDEDDRPQLRKKSSLTNKLSQRLDKASETAFSKLFGDSYSKRECAFVLLAGALIAFNSGFVNGSCLSGFLTPTRTQSVAGFTSAYTKSAMSLADGEFALCRYYGCLILSYMFGSFLSGLITPRGTPYQIEPTYGPTFMIGGIFLMAASVLAAFQSPPEFVFFLAAAANGVQNGIASIYSANLIRCSLTGSSTDVALVVAQCMRGNYSKLWKGMVLLMIIGNFWIGSFLSFYLTRRFLTYTLFFNAALFWLIGIGLVWFLVAELDVGVRAAIMGTWKWKRALETLQVSLRQGLAADLESGEIAPNLSLYDMFDEIDDDGNGEIDPDELLDALLKANVKINAKGVKVLIKAADANGDGMIDKEEWKDIVRKIEQ